ncbi:alpha/beta hydrolase [Pseudonocardia xishanensis]|uniref:Alpha/beta hydrolase fold-3 domain-containing protein n=1 Tax=Pseudonocardia xishanensis TaxID=630995 RepID=A0ABP8RFW2_9PSEU
MTLHPVIAEIVARARAASGDRTPGIADARAQLDAGTAALGAGPAVRRVGDQEVSGRRGPIPCRVYEDGDDPAGTVVYVHGGGWAIGGPTAFDPFARALCRRSGARVLLVDYALAPEQPFPRGLEDVEDALRWVAERYGADGPLVVVGDSAGANLTAAATIGLAGEVTPALQVLIYPVADCRFDRPSYLRYGEGLLLTRTAMEAFFRMYAPADQWTDPRISVLRHPDLARSPRTRVVTAEYDLLRDEGEELAEALAAAGVETTVHRYSGVHHGFLRLFELVDTADAALTDVSAAIHAATSPARSGRSPGE